MNKAFEYYILLGNNPNIIIKFTDRILAYNTFFNMKDECENLRLYKFEYSDGLSVTKTLAVCETKKENKV